MRKNIAQLLLLVGCLLMVSVLGFAQQITLGESSPNNVTFVNTGGNNVNLDFTGDCSGSGGGPHCLTGLGYYGANVGSYDMWIVGGPMTLGVPSGGVYPINMNGATIDFTFSAGSSFVDGTIDLFNATDGTNAPRFLGDLLITSSNIGGFPNGTYVNLDFNVYLGNNPHIDDVYNGTASSTYGPLSAGELNPVPEPSSIALFGSGILGLAGLLRRKLSL